MSYNVHRRAGFDPIVKLSCRIISPQRQADAPVGRGPWWNVAEAMDKDISSNMNTVRHGRVVIEQRIMDAKFLPRAKEAVWRGSVPFAGADLALENEFAAFIRAKALLGLVNHHELCRRKLRRWLLSMHVPCDGEKDANNPMFHTVHVGGTSIVLDNYSWRKGKKINPGRCNLSGAKPMTSFAGMRMGEAVDEVGGQGRVIARRIALQEVGCRDGEKV